MKQQIAHIIIMLLTGLNAWSQTTVTGTVTDGREPLAGANVFIMGTIDGSPRAFGSSAAGTTS